MKKSIKVKRAFTLIELILVILLVSIISFLALTGFNVKSQNKYKVELKDIKEFMLKNFKYEESLTLSCVEDEALSCYIFIDENLTKNIKIENLFSKIPQVFNYDKDLSNYEFSELRLDDTSYEPFFELTFNRDRKHKNMVIDTNEEKIYLFSSIFSKAEVFSETNEIIDRFFNMETEVRDAF